MDICQAGVKAYHRWLSDAFGPAKDRLLMVGILGQAPWRNMDEMIEELDWIADRGFRATSMPGFTAYPGQPPLFDKYWDPFWARCEERGLALWMHAGHGEGQGELGRELARVENQLKAKGGNFEEVAESYFKTLNNGKIFESVKPRRDGRRVRSLSSPQAGAERGLWRLAAAGAQISRWCVRRASR
jgi:hypothetical protein